MQCSTKLVALFLILMKMDPLYLVICLDKIVKELQTCIYVGYVQ